MPGLSGRLPPLLVLVILLGCAAGLQAPRYPDAPRRVAASPSILIVGDTQAPLWAETLRLRTDDNEDATWRIFRALGADSTCTAVIHLGDLTALGSFDASWEEFDTVTEPVRRSGVPLYPAFGNHEYMPFADAGRERFLARFPFAAPGWYERRIGPVAVAVLNSNFDQLSAEERVLQNEWYARTLARLDADSSVEAVLVACHHAPYTNSTIVGPDEEVRRSFVAPYLRTRKTRLFLSGHAHAFEHFRVGGKDFMVGGGGGGLLHPLRQGPDARWRNLGPADGDRSFFHYLRLTATPDRDGCRLAIDVMRMAADRRSFEPAYHAELP